MSKAHIRLIFNASLGGTERLAACNGARAFARFGVGCDYIDAGDRKELHHVRLGERIARIVRAANPRIRYGDLANESLWALIYQKTIFGMGVTPNPLLRLENGQAEACNGLAIPGGGAVLSTSRFSSDDSLKGHLLKKAISTVVRYELGHMLGVEKHCVNRTCLMQEYTDHSEFIEKLVKGGLDFCRECEERIQFFINSASRGL